MGAERGTNGLARARFRRPAGATRPRSPARQRPWHNLPQRSYTRFVGRQAELEKLTQLLLPHPRSRHFIVTLDGIGGVGKSALALELAYRYRDGYAALPEPERFEAIVWVSAKRTLLTAGGIQQRQQTFNTLADLYREIATVLEQPAIPQADANERRGLIERALTAQRTLLIVDNLETIDDEELLSLLREIPDPTKVIMTTRHRIDIAYTIRLTGMPEPDARVLMMVEAARKGVELTLGSDIGEHSSASSSSASAAVLDELYRKTGGIPLAIVWSIGLISLGHSQRTDLYPFRMISHVSVAPPGEAGRRNRKRYSGRPRRPRTPTKERLFSRIWYYSASQRSSCATYSLRSRLGGAPAIGPTATEARLILALAEDVSSP
ncbi:MAG TPA: ATP-binding protein, partial [Roseiflexaceae bacterium]|nr:ATP-binding protein [Roseiflexaceae bacterium]